MIGLDLFTRLLDDLVSNAYLRIGGITLLNSLELSDPTVPQFWAASINSVYTYSDWNPYSASVSNPSGLCGSSPDGNYATLYAGNYGYDGHQDDMAYIIANMNEEASGTVYVNGYSSAGYSSSIYVYVSNDGTNWYLLPDGYQIITADQPYYIDCGSSATNFQYVCILAYDTGDSVKLNVDSVQVIWEPTLEVVAYDDYGWDLLNTGVYVDGNYMGLAPLTITLPAGFHTVSVDDQTYDFYWGMIGFSYFQYNYNIYYYNDISIPIYSDETLYAFYDPFA